MKVIGLNGSPNAQGNTYLTIEKFFEEIRKDGFETEHVHIGDGKISGCVGCRGCAGTGECVFADDRLKELREKLLGADGIFLAAPVYFGTMPGQTKAVLDRLFFHSNQTGRLRLKVAATAAILRRTGGYTTIDDLNRFIFSGDMLMVGQCIIHGNLPGEILQDTEGLAGIRRLAGNMSWVLKMKDATKTQIAQPPYVKRPFTNFIR